MNILYCVVPSTSPAGFASLGVLPSDQCLGAEIPDLLAMYSKIHNSFQNLSTDSYKLQDPSLSVGRVNDEYRCMYII